jgi:hypothetical protein
MMEKYIIELSNGMTITVEEINEENAIRLAKKDFEKDFLESDNKFTVTKSR